MPVSPLSEAMLCLLIWELRLLDGPVVACHSESVAGNHPEEEYSGPAKKKTPLKDNLIQFNNKLGYEESIHMYMIRLRIRQQNRHKKLPAVISKKL